MWTKVPLKQRTLINFCKSKVKMKVCLTLRVNFYSNTFCRYLSLIGYNLGVHFWSKDSSFNITIDRVKFIEFGDSRVEVKHSSISKLKIYILRNNFCDPMFYALQNWISRLRPKIVKQNCMKYLPAKISSLNKVTFLNAKYLIKKLFSLFKLNPVAFLSQIKRLYRKTKMKVQKMKTPRRLKGWMKVPTKKTTNIPEKAIAKWVPIVLTAILMTVVSWVMNQCKSTC